VPAAVPENVRCADESLCDLRAVAALAIICLPVDLRGRRQPSRPTRRARFRWTLDLERLQGDDQGAHQVPAIANRAPTATVRAVDWIEAQ